MTSEAPIGRWAARGGAAAFAVLVLVTGMQVAATGTALAGGPPPPSCDGHTVTVTSPGAQTWAVSAPASLQIQATDSTDPHSIGGPTPLTYTATGLPAGLYFRALSTSASNSSPNRSG